MRLILFFKNWSILLHWWLWVYKIWSILIMHSSHPVHFKWRRLKTIILGLTNLKYLIIPVVVMSLDFKETSKTSKPRTLVFFVSIKFFPMLSPVLEVILRQNYHVWNSVAEMWLGVSSTKTGIYNFIFLYLLNLTLVTFYHYVRDTVSFDVHIWLILGCYQFIP